MPEKSPPLSPVLARSRRRIKLFGLFGGLFVAILLLIPLGME